MRIRNVTCLALCAAASLTITFAPVHADDSAPSTAASSIATPNGPLKLARFTHRKHRPVASAAVRAVKTKDGRYVAVSHHGKASHRGNGKATAKADLPLAMPSRPAERPATPTFTNVPSAAAEAFASIPYATARVRVVTPEQVDDIQARATEAAFAPAPMRDNAPTLAYNGVKVVSADQINEIDLKADTVEPAALDAATSADVPAAPDKHETATLMQRMLLALGGAFATAAAAVKALIG